MKKEYTRIDDVFKNKLEGYESPLPDHLWDAVEAGINPEKKVNNNRLIWIFLALLFIGTFAGIGAYQYADNDVVGIDNTIIETTPQHDAQQNLLEKATEEQEDASIRVDKVEKEQKNNQDQPQATILSTKKGSQLLVKNNTTTRVSVSNVKNMAQPITSTEEIETTRYKNLTPVSEGQQESSLHDEVKQSGATNRTDLVFDSSLEKKSPRLPVVPLLEKEPQLLDIQFPWDLKCPKLNIPSDPPNFYAEAIFGFDYAQKVLDVKNDGLDDYAQIREETEVYSSAYNAGIRFTASYRTGFVWKTGLIYNRINEKILPRRIEGTEGIENIDLLDENNSYHFVDVPILLGYEASAGKWNIGFNAGAYFNLLFKSPTNYILSEDKMIIDLDDQTVLEETPVFKGQIGISLYSGLSFVRNITDDLSFIIEPNFRYLPKSITLDAYALDQKYYTIGLMTGLRYKF